MRLDRLMEQCRTLEERAAALYRSFAAAARNQPALCALWTDLARDEEAHARSIAQVNLRVRAPEGWQTRIEGWEEAIGEIEERLAAAEQLGTGASPDRQLSAALELEMSELEALRRFLLGASHLAGREPAQVDHAIRLAEAATRLSNDSQVRLQAALVRARTRLKSASP